MPPSPPERPPAPQGLDERLYGALFRLVLRRLDPELAHRLAFAALRGAARVPGVSPAVRRALAPPPDAGVEVAGVRFPGRFGLAAGFDKEGRGVPGLGVLGFAFVEVGTVTPRAQPGNERPRLWREPGGHLRNRMGFNNDGAPAVAARLAALRATPLGRAAVVGVNVGKSRTTPHDRAAGDYAECARLLAPHADYLVVNVSSPNTPGLRDLQAVDALRPVLVAARDAARAAAPARRVPLLVKIAPDLSDADVDAVADLVAELGLDGVVAVNTTVAHDLGPGGLSGPALRARGLAVVARLRRRLGPHALVVGVGGVSAPADALAYRRAGADLVQGYTGFVYRGPGWARRLNRALASPSGH
ncbi:quinone-dependent dihydroorotate dehydrogenase [Quadrisphaera sp. DSM 44207]|uniref:quinone-dependent dihydroorotate dehydrogenase n=1 Tax=Quadrisphaera sp. DSM 44207 TaxID=1881057 RepID=UPI000887C137|nr:quinone-dependent dihydroorotate dehydrogenase [Quadrisphaera sp. DSM 44207]SDQ46122.1 dihydroorotate oxidase A [Quadrisphaera sp. DSM 44207]